MARNDRNSHFVIDPKIQVCTMRPMMRKRIGACLFVALGIAACSFGTSGQTSSGVDVPAATVMVIHDADRFGLAQLHQLRGRVGRGGDKSYCFLFADPSTEDGEQRLEAMAASTDGFALAEKDLEIRGSGEVFGGRQSGFSDLKLGRIPRDEEIVMQTRRVAEEILDVDPELVAHSQLAGEVHDLLGDAVDFLFKS